MRKWNDRVFQLKIVLTTFAFFCIVSCSAKSDQSEAASSMFERDDAVKNAYMTILVEEVDEVRNEIFKSLGRFSCEVESENWYNMNKISESISMGIKLPSSKFLEYIDYIDSKYEVESMRMYARKTNDKSIEKTEIDSMGIVYSFIHISINKKIGFIESFLIGRESASEALKISLQSIIPVVLFLLPYLLIIGIIITLIKLIKMKIK